MATFNELGSGGINLSGLSYVPDRVIFDGPNRLIIINGTENISIRQDIYSAWKLWAMEGDNLKYLFAMRSVGGDPLPGNQFLGSTYLLQNQWKIQIHNDVVMDGNLFSSDGSNPYETTSGVIMATSKISVLVERIEAPVTDNARIFV